MLSGTVTVDRTRGNGPDHSPHLGGTRMAPESQSRGPPLPVRTPLTDPVGQPSGGLLHLPQPHPRPPPTPPHRRTLNPASETPPHHTWLSSLRLPPGTLGPPSHLLDSAPGKDLGRPGGVWTHREFVSVVGR